MFLADLGFLRDFLGFNPIDCISFRSSTLAVLPLFLISIFFCF